MLISDKAIFVYLDLVERTDFPDQPVTEESDDVIVVDDCDLPWHGPVD
ncbi:hypothetical protein [Dyadobacter sp. 50-39]|nr:hypothetical protein [Dyadobacter sp. 50-39]